MAPPYCPAFNYERSMPVIARRDIHPSPVLREQGNASTFRSPNKGIHTIYIARLPGSSDTIIVWFPTSHLIKSHVRHPYQTPETWPLNPCVAGSIQTNLGKCGATVCWVGIESLNKKSLLNMMDDMDVQLPKRKIQQIKGKDDTTWRDLQSKLNVGGLRPFGDFNWRQDQVNWWIQNSCTIRHLCSKSILSIVVYPNVSL